MKFFNNHPKCRMVFAVVYILYFAKYMTPLSIGNAVIAICGLFGAYISIVKSGIIKDKYAESISNFNFDLISVGLSIGIIFMVM